MRGRRAFCLAYAVIFSAAAILVTSMLAVRTAVTARLGVESMAGHEASIALSMGLKAAEDWLLGEIIRGNAPAAGVSMSAADMPQTGGDPAHNLLSEKGVELYITPTCYTAGSPSPWPAPLIPVVKSGDILYSCYFLKSRVAADGRGLLLSDEELLIVCTDDAGVITEARRLFYRPKSDKAD
jgi:hypothetical protein